MAEELFLESESFSLDLQWPANPGKGGVPLLDESVARVQMIVADKSVTSYETEKGIKNSHIHIPVYYLVEWLALNWWSFLYEPRKLDRDEIDADFRSRHWLGTPRNGFAIPDITFSPAGSKTEVVARSTFLRFAQLNFIESVTASVATETVRNEFSSFVQQVLERLSEKGIKNTVAHKAWASVIETSEEEEDYCRLIGSMGLSPYVSHPEVDSALNKIADTISSSMLVDLCDATNIVNFSRAAEFTGAISKLLNDAAPIRLHDLLKAKKPPDSLPKAYDWGYKATDAARAALGISPDDPRGSAVFFDRLHFNSDVGLEAGAEGVAVLPILGAVEREDDAMRLSLVGSNPTHRKFAAARASFLAWSSAKKDSRLVTSARTREQQASRAFAAELLAPAMYLKKRLGRRGDVSPFVLDKISEEMGVASTVVRYQAKNNGYFIAEGA